MTIPTPKVEIGFDLTDSPIAPFFRLDDSVAGRLDNTEYKLGGTIFVDVTDRVRGVSVGRGRPAVFTNFPAGQLQVDLNNHDRAFDPTFAASPFAGNIVPRREIRVSANGQRVFTGWIEDWDLLYTPDGDSIVSAVAYDAFYIMAGQSILEDFTPPVETANERIDRVLDRPGVNWAQSLRDLEVSTQNMGDYLVEAETNALDYMQRVAESEPGKLFVTKDGKIKFDNRATELDPDNFITMGEGGIRFSNINVIYGAENLYNEVIVTRQSGGTAIASDITSQGQYGVRTLTVSDLLVETNEQAAAIAVEYASRYSQPEYRVESLEFNMEKLSTEQETQLFGLEIGDSVEFVFTPNNVAPAIEKYLEITRIEHRFSPEGYYLVFGFTETSAPFILDSAEFGRLDVDRLSW